MEYTSVKLPKAMVEEIRRMLEEHQELGYCSVQEFVKDAVRDKLLLLNIGKSAKIEQHK